MRRATATHSGLGEERGAAMIIAVIILMIVSTLATVAVAVAVQTNGSCAQNNHNAVAHRAQYSCVGKCKWRRIDQDRVVLRP